MSYGAGDQYYSTLSSGEVACTNEPFGDPDVGVPKECYCASSVLPTGFNKTHNSTYMQAVSKAWDLDDTEINNFFEAYNWYT